METINNKGIDNLFNKVKKIIPEATIFVNTWNEHIIHLNDEFECYIMGVWSRDNVFQYCKKIGSTITSTDLSKKDLIQQLNKGR